MRLGCFINVKEITGDVAKIYRYFGISRKTYYKCVEDLIIVRERHNQAVHQKVVYKLFKFIC
ncbi:MAG: hypothetical protein NC824_03695 [Candidatus Omnitrophica bacterium]|nr:hypothetical protein [Candidatus Omnitrophota bacterium]